MKFLIAIFCACFLFQAHTSARPQTENVILVTLDGARTQEIFGGIDTRLYEQIKEDASKTEIYKRFDANTASRRREKLMPFFWQTWMKNHGSIAGNRALGSVVRTKNNRLFSYPGYSEIMTGEAHDDVIKSNARIQNPYPSVLQFLQKKLRLNFNQVASFASWNVMNEIVSSEPDAFLINAGYEIYRSEDKEISRLSAAQYETPTPWDSVRHDFYTFRLAMAHMRKHRPRVMHIGLGETDDWAHNKRYDLMLQALHRTDNYFRELWRFVSSHKQYRGKTTIIITVDHGRGPTKNDWDGHGGSVPESRYIWAAFISPDSKVRGEWKNTKTIYQNQIAATLAYAIGFDFSEQNPGPESRSRGYFHVSLLCFVKRVPRRIPES